jgi:hypothetical protein
MPSDEFLAANRRNRDERVPIHRRDRTGFYAVERFLAGEKRLHAVELGELGDVAGKRLIHLQCHFGLDTLILARYGARVTGSTFTGRNRGSAAAGRQNRARRRVRLRQCLRRAARRHRRFRHRLCDLGHHLLAA